ncbi:methyl-accepting chemotaxis protein [Vibrio sp.]|uniref:methyl-accepting chemotaxis protein n=1 Tax=Vibrio sp. TaxID=678 RepID=UPI003D0C3820
MKRIIHRFPLFIVVSLLAGIPITIALVLAVNNVLDHRHTLNNVNRDQETVNLIILYDNLAHNLAVERGLTAGVLGSKGQGVQVAKLKQHRKVVDQQIRLFNDYQPQYNTPNLLNKLRADIDKHLSQLTSVRSGVDALKPTIAPFSYYSNLNHLIIDNANVLLTTLTDKTMSETGSALISLIVMKEKTGQIRGALNGAFARKASTPSQYTSIQQYILTTDYAKRQAAITLPGQFASPLNAAEKQPIWQQVNQVQQAYLAQVDNLANLEGPSPAEWFGAATKKIGLINQIRNNLQQQLIEYAEQTAQQAAWMQKLLLTLTIVVSVLLVAILISAVKSLRYRVGHLTNHLTNISNSRDLSQEISSSGRDEISVISFSINGLTQSIRRLLLDVTDTNNHSNQRLDDIIGAAKDLGQSSQATTAKCDNIAAAMTELSQSALEIAGSSDRALEETNAMTQQVVDCQQQSQIAFGAVEALVQQIEQTETCMQDLEQDAASVSKIVETINGISEQTNLLALNAAIEAARAGEHGRGFAVVSSEVRDLAQRSKEATEHISALLDNITNNTDTAVQNMNKSREATDKTFASVSEVNTSVARLETVIETVNQHITSIANSTTEQSKACEDVDKDVDILANIANQTGQLANNMNNIVDAYQTEVQQVNHQLQEFKLS